MKINLDKFIDKKIKDYAEREKEFPWNYEKGVIFQADLIRETLKAYLLSIRLHKKKSYRRIWVPKEQVDFEPGHVWLPSWVLNKYRIRPEDGDPDLNFKEDS